MENANNKPYVFISYAHADSNTVLPILDKMRQNNICLWFDEGIEAGSEWPEYIAEKVINCTKFLLFISPSYLNSQNCKRELNFAISRKKDLLSVYIEDVELSPGMEMQLGTYQSVFRNRFNSFDEFANSLSREHFFDSCLENGSPNPRPENTVPTHTSASNNTLVGHDLIDEEPAPPMHNQPLRKTAEPVTHSQPTTPHTTNGHQKSAPTSINRILYGQNPSGSSTRNTTSQSGYDPNNPMSAYSRSNNSGLSNTNIEGQTKRKLIAVLLAIFFGAFGAHLFYLNDKKNGGIRLAITLVAMIIFSPLTVITSVWGIVDGIKLINMTCAQIESKYNCRVID